MTQTSRILFLTVLFLAAGLGTHVALGQIADNSPSSAPPVKVSPDVASTLLIQRSALKYPDAARAAGIEGTVVLRMVVSETGAVKEVTIVSGNPILAQPTADSVKQWKYKPYTVNNVPVEMETEFSINFHFKPTQSSPPPLGTFKDDTYSNDVLGIEYPLSRDWVRETEIMREKAAGEPPGTAVLLAAVHIPQHTAPLKADSSFVLSLLEGGSGARESRDKYLQALAAEIHSSKQGQQKGDVSKSTIAGRDYYRADFEFRADPRHRAFICAQSKNYLLRWNINGLSKNAVDGAVATLNLIQSPTPQGPAAPPASDAALKPALNGPPLPSRVRVSQGVTSGMVIKKVQPIYPEEARQARIQGTVRMSAVISKTGDVVDLEVIEGPIELVVSAVNAVRQWKYRPYVLKGEPIEVDTQLTVNYTLTISGR